MTQPELPPHLGRIVDAETGYALVCNLVPAGDPATDPICGQPAAWHLRWAAETTENSFACGPHLTVAAGFGYHDLHSIEGGACGLPGSAWVDDQPSYCTMLALDEEPDRSGHVRLALAQLVEATP